MLPKLSLLEEIKKGGYEASLITTYNAYLPFYEDVVLRRLVNAGVRHNVLMMDARQYAISVASHPPKLSGRKYTLMPMTVDGAFHPKLIFLAGKNKVLVIVGSHNMTLAGFGFNRELTNHVRIQGPTDLAGIALAQSIWSEIESWLSQFAANVPQPVKAMVRGVRDFAPWMTTAAVPDKHVRLLAGRPGGPSLWDQLMSMIDGDVSQVAMAGPFFDAKLEFVKRVNAEMRPKRLLVAIDSRTAQIPLLARSIAEISLVQANRFGVEEKDEESGRYLHGKGIFVQQANGVHVLAVGSANPSAPAWLSNETAGNVEMMIARRGGEAAAAAESLGFSAIPQFPAIGDAEWQQIAANAERQLESTPPSYRTGVAVIEHGSLSFDVGLLGDSLQPEFTLIGPDSQPIKNLGQFRVEEGRVVLAVAAEELNDALELHCVVAGQLVLKLLLHHVSVIEEQSRTGTQRRFKEALLSLNTDTPNFELLLDSIQKIVFNEEHAAATPAMRRSGTRQREESQIDAPDTLAIDVSQIKKRKVKSRLNHSSDLAYLLDSLIYHLRVVDDKALDEVDEFGRSEEEQIGADDDQRTEVVAEIAQRQDDVLRVCHSKVATIINRMNDFLQRFSQGERSFSDVVVRVLGVLAMLRELRHCDGRVTWVQKGRTTVPQAQRLRLLDGIMFSLFERNASDRQCSLLNLNPLGADFEQSDDVARLKGLVLWLAWDCGLTMKPERPFMESREELDMRLQRNAMMLALAQMIRDDEVVIDEARQSIGSLSSTELQWLTDVERLASRCNELRHDESSLKAAAEAEAGDIAVHRKFNNWELRVVASGDEKSVELIRLAREKESVRYRPDHLAVIRIGTVAAVRSPR